MAYPGLFSLISCLILALMMSVQAQNLPPATLFGTGQQICNYQYAIPTGGNCVTYGPSLEHNMQVVQQDMNRLRLQYVGQNSVLQEELRKLKQQASTTNSNVADLTKELKNLQTTVFQMQTTVANGNTNYNNNNNGGGIPATDAMLQQLVTSTRTQLTQSMLKLENELNKAVSTMQRDRQRDAIQQSKVDSAFQAQLRQQQLDLTAVLQNLQQLQSQVSSIRQSTSSPGNQQTAATTTTPVTFPPVTGGNTVNPLLVQQLQNGLQKLDTRVSQVEKDSKNLQTDIPALKKDVINLQDLTANHTLALSSAQLEADTALNQVQQLQQDVQKNYGAISNQAQIIQPLKQQVDKVEKNFTSLNSQLVQLALQTKNQEVKMHTDETAIGDLKIQIQFLASRLTNVIKNNGLGTATSSPNRPAVTTQSIIAPTPRPPHGMITPPKPGSG